MTIPTFNRYFWTAIYVSGGILLGTVFVIYFSSIEKLNAGSPLLWAFAYLVMGALLGFIFSVPKIISDNHPNQAADMESLKNPAVKNKIEENTNLTQVSDWLTKVLIGAGLVQLKDIPGFVLHMAEVMGRGMRNLPAQNNAVDSVTIMCAAIILYFITWGFISGYLVMKLVLTEQFAGSE